MEAGFTIDFKISAHLRKPAQTYKSSGLLALCGIILMAAGCATETSRSVPVETATAAQRPYSGPKAPVALGEVENHSNFRRGVFSDGRDRLGNQAKTILKSHLQQSGRFQVLDRANMKALEQETGYRGESPAIEGARFLITGDVTEFGRKTVGDQQLFGLLGRGKAQVAYAKVTLNVVDTRTSAVVFSVQGAGEYELSEREILGFGSTAGYDSTLNGKVLDLAMREAVDALADGVESGAWPANVR
jgi:curli biogenesis system outer membrane secretion channel CsgG